jgi:recyclin-1
MESDLNAYYEWACGLRVQQVTRLFTALKEVGNLYIADGVAELRDIVNDQNKFQGVFRLEEILELLNSRSDYKNIQKHVESKECIIQ